MHKGALCIARIRTSGMLRLVLLLAGLYTAKNRAWRGARTIYSWVIARLMGDFVPVVRGVNI